MKTRNLRTFALFATALLMSSHGAAIGLGEISVQSSLGQPFRASIPLQGDINEDVDLACLNLAPPPPVDGMVYLRRARLSLSEQDGIRQLLISGTHALNEPYLIVVIQSGCQTQGRLLREYTVLIDPPAGTAVEPPSGSEQQTSIDTLPWGARPEKEIAPPTPASDQPVQTTVKKRHGVREKKTGPISPPGRDQLKVISGVGEAQAKAEQTEKERLQQREKELMKELDDKTAQFLAMQSQLEKLETKLAEMQKTIALQNKMMASMQQAPAPATTGKPGLSWYDYWLAGPVILIAGMGYFIARLSRRRSLANWEPNRRA